jgi:hypothetical protein
MLDSCAADVLRMMATDLAPAFSRVAPSAITRHGRAIDDANFLLGEATPTSLAVCL